MKASRLIVLILGILFIAAVVILAVTRGDRQESVSPVTPASPTGSAGEVSVSPTASPALKPQVRATQMPRASREMQLAELRRRFGAELQAEFLEDGRLASLQIPAGRGLPAEGGFEADNPQSAIARAREILDTARELLGLRADSPLENPLARSGAGISQVTFQQSKDGVPVAPFGGVTVALGAQGELKRIDSTYVAPLEVVNELKLEPDQAKAHALSEFPETGGAAGLKAEGGKHLIWINLPVPGSGAGAVEGRHAYEVFVQGRQVIVDASDGRVIFKRDRRNF